ncbi:hypothetical protein [Estrella lausannensis]|uniref:Uncharacterized protein n=1 Tax=Estrella lausannensis TaxID=483423 RepID=A0A0H5DMV6_9BACT|nr:hypothetical protein [Estrella lausannensis]CRX37506.1 hypothetical protein ELAC_0144 [Estrella lausannensis]
MEEPPIHELSLKAKENKLRELTEEFLDPVKLEELIVSSCHEAMESAEKTFHTFRQIAADLEEEYKKVFAQHKKE